MLSYKTYGLIFNKISIALLAVLCALHSFNALSHMGTEINMVSYRENANEFLQEQLKQFEKQTGHKVNFIFVNIHDLKPLLLKGSMKDSLPDVVLAPSDLIALAKTIKLSPVPDSLLVPEIKKDAITSVQNYKQTYGVPIMGGNHLVLYYNKNYVTEVATTWQELRAQEAEFSKKGIKTLGFNYPEMYWFTAFATTFGGAPVTDGKLTLNSQAYVDALKYFKELSSAGFISKRCGYDCVYKDFMAGKYAYAINGEWALGDFQKAFGDKLGIALIPAIGDKPFKPLSSTAALIFPSMGLEGEKKHALTELAQFFQSEAIQSKLSHKAQSLPVREDVFQQLKAKATPNIKMLLEQLTLSQPMPADAVMLSAWSGMRKGWARYMKGVLSAEKAAAYMQQFAERDYKKYQNK